MIKVVSLWALPAGMSEDEFESWYVGKHIGDAQKIPGLRRYTVNRVVPEERANTRFYRMAELGFDTMDAARAAFESEEWRYAFADAKRYIGEFMRFYFDSTDIKR
ncbi:EthD family reductase [Ramlibacter sp. G-1-2-2]|uniref:EthD family reductase n=1 Tax=Ramlibacter agri TaxID=2728837 RepID=A0A848HDT1_9BURK|nr:EthD family reductase [Ramlibacter agri]NML45718.1 EthD family reductase [Ramlibacter agri]